MLTVAKIPSKVAAGYADYLQGKVQPAELGDYYLKDGERVEAPGRWISGASAVGADQTAPVSGEQLRALMDVRRPDTGTPLRPAGGDGTAVAGIDATFSAPKSVSAVWAVADPALRAAVERAHELAVDRAMSYAVARVAMIRERVSPGQVIHAHAAEVIATGWRHTTARAVQNQVPDPQLHSHVLIHAAVRRDGRVVAVDSRSWFVHRRELGAAYRTELARELAALGFAIQRGTGRGGRYFEIDGVPAALIDRWSSRHHQVQQAITARLADKRQQLEAILATGGPDAAAAAKALERLRSSSRLPAAEDRYLAWSTRTAKTLTTHHQLDHAWTHAATTTGFTRHQIDRLRHNTWQPTPAPPGTLRAALTEFDSTFEHREARAVALEVSAGLPIPDALATLAKLEESGDVLDLVDGRSTTHLHRRREQITLALADRIAVGPAARLRGRRAQREINRLDAELAAKDGELSDEQREAIRIGTADRRLVVIVGQAGTGKTTALVGIARAHHADGQQILTTSTSALAAQRLAADLHAAGVPATPHSTVALHAAITSGRTQLGPHTTVIHDEAALASTREQHHLLTDIDRSGARLIAVGDPAQNQPVGAGGLWPHLEHTAQQHHALVHLTRNLRARNPADRRDQHLFRTGDHEQALAGYAARGHVIISADQRQAEDAALEAAHADHQAGKHTIVIAQTSNEHLDQLNARAQAIRLQSGELGRDSLPVPGRSYHLHPGDPIQIRHTIPQPGGPLRNGTTATIQTINPHHHTAQIRLDTDRTATLTAQQLQDADVRLAYVQHPFPAQGTTTDTTHLITAQHTTHQGSYVALTRARDTTHIHVAHDHLDPHDPIPALAQHMSRHEPETPSITTPLAHEHSITHHPEQPYSVGASDITNRPADTGADWLADTNLAQLNLQTPAAFLHHSQPTTELHPAADHQQTRHVDRPAKCDIGSDVGWEL